VVVEAEVVVIIVVRVIYYNSKERINILLVSIVIRCICGICTRSAGINSHKSKIIGGS